MILYGADGSKFRADKVSRPKFASRRGRTWDYENAKIDNEELKFWIDTTWGFNFYFELDNYWYRIPLFGRRGKEIGIDERREFFTRKPVG